MAAWNHVLQGEEDKLLSSSWSPHHSNFQMSNVNARTQIEKLANLAKSFRLPTYNALVCGHNSQVTIRTLQLTISNFVPAFRNYSFIFIKRPNLIKFWGVCNTLFPSLRIVRNSNILSKTSRVYNCNEDYN